MRLMDALVVNIYDCMELMFVGAEGWGITGFCLLLHRRLEGTSLKQTRSVIHRFFSRHRHRYTAPLCLIVVMFFFGFYVMVFE